MNEPKEIRPPAFAEEATSRPLDRGANRVLRGMLDDLRNSLLVQANFLADGTKITEEDLSRAYNRLTLPNRDSLQFADAQAVISRALKENKVIEVISYVMAIILFGSGLSLLFLGVFWPDDLSTRIGAIIGGSVTELLILIPFRFAINSRRHNIAIRMLGLILNRVDDPDQFAKLLDDTFLGVVLGQSKSRDRSS